MIFKIELNCSKLATRTQQETERNPPEMSPTNVPPSVVITNESPSNGTFDFQPNFDDDAYQTRALLAAIMIIAIAFFVGLEITFKPCRKLWKKIVSANTDDEQHVPNQIPELEARTRNTLEDVPFTQRSSNATSLYNEYASTYNSKPRFGSQFTAENLRVTQLRPHNLSYNSSSPTGYSRPVNSKPTNMSKKNIRQTRRSDDDTTITSGYISNPSLDYFMGNAYYDCGKVGLGHDFGLTFTSGVGGSGFGFGGGCDSGGYSGGGGFSSGFGYDIGGFSGGGVCDIGGGIGGGGCDTGGGGYDTGGGGYDTGGGGYDTGGGGCNTGGGGYDTGGGGCDSGGGGCDSGGGGCDSGGGGCD